MGVQLMVCLLAQEELEAESTAYLVCARNGVYSKGETYLSKYVTEKTTLGDIDVYQVMRAAGQVETLLGLSAHTSFSNAAVKGASQNA